MKIITTGEGGIATTNNSELYKKIGILREHGIERDNKKLKNKGKWYYEHQILGYNYRLSDIHASLGNSQILKIKKFLKLEIK